MNGRVSVVIPTYNGSLYVAEAIDSVFAQTRLPAELIVVDDCSHDETVPAVEQCLRRSPIPGRLVRLQQNSGGPATPINVGIEAAAGDIIAVLDQDDILMPETLQRHAEALGGVPHAAFSFGLAGRWHQPDVDRSAIANEIRGLTRRHGCWKVVSGPDLKRLLIRRGNFLWGFPAFAFRRTAWDATSIRPKWRIAADLDYLMTLCDRGDAVFLSNTVYLRREHANNVCRAVGRMYLDVAAVFGNVISRDSRMRSDAEVQEAGRRWWLRAAEAFGSEGNLTAVAASHIQCIRAFGPNREILHSMWKTSINACRRRFRHLYRKVFALPKPSGARPGSGGDGEGR